MDTYSGIIEKKNFLDLFSVWVIRFWALVPPRGLPGGAVVKNLPAEQETQAPCLGQEGHLEKEMATHSSIRAWEIPGTEKPGRLSPLRWQSDMT